MAGIYYVTVKADDQCRGCTNKSLLVIKLDQGTVATNWQLVKIIRGICWVPEHFLFALMTQGQGDPDSWRGPHCRSTGLHTILAPSSPVLEIQAVRLHSTTVPSYST